MSGVEDTSSGTTVRVVVVDDHPVFRIGMVALLEALDVRGGGRPGSHPGRGGGRGGPRTPDVVVMDLDLGAGSGVEATRAIVRAQPSVGCAGGHHAR